MKKLTLTLALLLSTSTFSQIAPPKRSILLNLPKPSSAPNMSVGPGMMIGGATFVAAGLLTPPFMVAGSTTQKKPFYQQGPRAAAIISGSIVFVVGIGYTIGGK
jgi:hypothetical protein